MGRGAGDQKKGVGGTMDTVGMTKRPSESMSNAPMDGHACMHAPKVYPPSFTLRARYRVLPRDGSVRTTKL